METEKANGSYILAVEAFKSRMEDVIINIDSMIFILEGGVKNQDYDFAKDKKVKSYMKNYRFLSDEIREAFDEMMKAIGDEEMFKFEVPECFFVRKCIDRHDVREEEKWNVK
jgi:hypothetical protein